MTDRDQSPTVPFAIACLGIASFAAMDVVMKSLSIEMGAYNAMLWRTSIAVVIAAVLFIGRRERWPTNATIRFHIWRGVVTSLMAFLFFWGLVRVPLAEAIGLSFIAPLMAKPIEIAFFQCATMAAVYALLAPFLAVTPGVDQLPSLAGGAVLSITALLLLSWAYARAEAKILIPVEYTAFIWAALFGWLVFAEAVTVTTLVGTAFIVAGCLIATRQQPDHIDHVETTAL